MKLSTVLFSTLALFAVLTSVPAARAGAGPIRWAGR